MPHVVEKALNHTMEGVMAIYNRADYEPERVNAMQQWADELDRLLSGSAKGTPRKTCLMERAESDGRSDGEQIMAAMDSGGQALSRL